MKTRKRLQAILVVMAMLVAVFGSVTVVSADEELPGPYQASEAFTQEFVDSTNGNQKPADYNLIAPWRWQYYDGTDKSEPYKDFTAGFNLSNKPFKSETDYPIGEAVDPTGGAAIRRANVDSTTKVGRYWMTGEMSSNDLYYPVRTFVVPETGNITITAENKNPGEAGTIRSRKRSASASVVGARLMLKKSGEETLTQLWPSEQDSAAVTSTPFGGKFMPIPPDGTVAFPPLTTNIEKGDVLYFEIAKIINNTSALAAAYWDPVVTYNSLSFVLPGPYQASEAFTQEFVDSTNGNQKPADYNLTAPWRWQYYDGAESKSYQDLSMGFNLSNKPFTGDTYPIGETVDPTGGAAIRRANDDATTKVGRYWMTAEMSKDDPYYPVRTFVAPETGNVTITAENDNPGEAGTIRSRKRSASTAVVGARLMMKKSGEETLTQLWPSEQDSAAVTSTPFGGKFMPIPPDGTVAFPPLTTNVERGDVLYFEIAKIINNTSALAAAYWDPVVSYNKALTTGEVTFSGGTSMEDVAQALTQDEVTVTVPVTAYYMTVDSVTPIAAVYDNTGMLVSCGVGETQALGMNQPTDLTVTLPKIDGSAPADGYIKVFLWDSTEELTPISDIGGAAILGELPVSPMTAYVGFGEPG